MHPQWVATALGPLDLDKPSDSRSSRGTAAVVGLVSQGVVRLLTSVMIGRVLGPGGLGLVGNSIATAQLSSVVWPTSVGGATSRFVAYERGRADYARASAVAAYLARQALASTIVLALILAGVLAALGAEPASVGATTLLFIAYSGQALARGAHFGYAQGNRLAIWEALTAVVTLTGLIAVLMLNGSATAVVAWLAAPALVQSAVCWPWHARGHIDGPSRRHINRAVILATAGSISSAGFFQLSVLSAGSIGGANGAGQYVAALALATPLLLLSNAVSVAHFPALSEISGRNVGSPRDSVDITTRSLFFCIGGAVGVMTLLAGAITRLIWGDSFADVEILLPLVLVAVLAGAIVVPSVNYLTIHSHKVALVSTLLSSGGLLIGVTIWWLMPSNLGAAGVAAGYLLGKAFFALAAMTVSARMLSIDWLDLIPKATAGGVIIGGLLLIDRQLSSGWLLELASATAFAVFWTTVCRRELASLRALAGRPAQPGGGS